MLVNKYIKTGTLLLSLPFIIIGCSVPKISKGAKTVRVVNSSNCPAVGNIMSFHHDYKKDLNYKNHSKKVKEHHINLVRDKAYKLGANRVVKVYSKRDGEVQFVMAFYSAHKCRK